LSYLFSGDKLKLEVLSNFLQATSTERGSMFPEFRELITKLKTTDRHFSHLFDKHNNLDQKIQRMETHIEAGTHEEIETLKKEKLLLKDQLYAVLKKASLES
jgi:hypothetical protein